MKISRKTEFRTTPLPIESRVVREPARPRALGTARAVWRRLKEANARFEDSWVGDLIGVICLWVILFGSFWFFPMFSEVFK